MRTWKPGRLVGVGGRSVVLGSDSGRHLRQGVISMSPVHAPRAGPQNFSHWNVTVASVSNHKMRVIECVLTKNIDQVILCMLLGHVAPISNAPCIVYCDGSLQKSYNGQMYIVYFIGILYASSRFKCFHTSIYLSK